MKDETIDTLLADFVTILVSGTASEMCKGLKKTGHDQCYLINLREEIIIFFSYFGHGALTFSQYWSLHYPARVRLRAMQIKNCEPSFLY